MDNTHQPGHRDRPKAGREVEAGFERLLKDAMTQQQRASAGSECIDVETLAAWSEGVLPPSERSMVEAHAARCVRCQEMLAVMARTAPVEAAGRSWSLRHWIMMLAPAATAAAAVILWFAIEPRRQVSDAAAHQVAANSEVDKLTSPQAKASPVAPAEAPARDDRAAAHSPTAKEAGPPAGLAEAKDSDRYLRQNQQSGKPTAESTTASTRSRQERGAALDEEQRRRIGAAGERSASDTLADAKASSRPAAKTSDAAAAPSSVVAEPPQLPAATPPPAPPAAPVAVTTPPSQAQTAQTQQSADFQKSAREPAAFGADAGRSGATLNRATLNESVSIATLAIAPAGARVQWRVLSGHIVQQSVDKGATWTTQYALDETVQLAAGSAPSSTAAWFVGRGGLVVATSDGRIWRRIAFPEAIDLIAVVATDARVAIVTSADRRVFTTTDGGASWLPRKN
jgi:hypothetical protein